MIGHLDIWQCDFIRNPIESPRSFTTTSVKSVCSPATGRPKACFRITHEPEWEWPSQERLNPKDLRTKLLRACVFSMRMDRKDVLKAFDVAHGVFTFLSKRGAKPVHITGLMVGFRGKRLPFSKLREQIVCAL